MVIADTDRSLSTGLVEILSARWSMLAFSSSAAARLRNRDKAMSLENFWTSGPGTVRRLPTGTAARMRSLAAQAGQRLGRAQAALQMALQRLKGEPTQVLGAATGPGLGRES